MAEEQRVVWVTGAPREAFLFPTLRRLLPGWMFEPGVRRGMGLDGADPVPVSGGAS